VAGGIDFLVGIVHAGDQSDRLFLVTPQTTIIKAIHITDLRQRIDTLRANARLAQFIYTDSPLSAGTSPVRAIHVTEMRNALNEVYAAVGRPAPTYTDPALAARRSDQSFCYARVTVNP
jgi:hypothetical protein